VHFEALQELAVRISGERSVDAVLQSIVHGLAQQPSVALTRVWVTGPGDVCGSCRMRAVCPDHTACLHLSASSGTSLTGQPWSRLDGTFRRVPFGNSSMESCPSPVRAIATDRTGQLLHVSACSQWAHPDWIQQETIQSFAGHPLVFRGETLGVLGVFRRALINEEECVRGVTVRQREKSSVGNLFTSSDTYRSSRQKSWSEWRQRIPSVGNETLASKRTAAHPRYN
jgi:hypothetical protein